MSKIIKHMIRGCGNLHYCGDHPGTAFVFTFILIGFIVGADKGGWKGSIIGGGLMGLSSMPLYLYGSYERSVLDEELTKQNREFFNE